MKPKETNIENNGVFTNGRSINMIHDSVRECVVYTFIEFTSLCEHYGFSFFRSSGLALPLRSIW